MKQTRTKVMRLLSGEPSNIIEAAYMEELRDKISKEELDRRYRNMLILLAQVVPGNNSYVQQLKEKSNEYKKAS